MLENGDRGLSQAERKRVHHHCTGPCSSMTGRVRIGIAVQWKRAACKRDWRQRAVVNRSFFTINALTSGRPVRLPKTSKCSSGSLGGSSSAAGLCCWRSGRPACESTLQPRLEAHHDRKLNRRSSYKPWSKSLQGVILCSSASAIPPFQRECPSPHAWVLCLELLIESCKTLACSYDRLTAPSSQRRISLGG